MARFFASTTITTLLLASVNASSYGSGSSGTEAVYVTPVSTGSSGVLSSAYANSNTGSTGAYPSLSSIAQGFEPFSDYVAAGPGYSIQGPANVAAAVQSRRTVEVKPVQINSDSAEPHVVDVGASVQPVHLIFRSLSSPVMIQQIHTPAEQQVSEPTQSEDEPHRVQHQVMRPIIQEVREIIQPFRKVLQEIRPVLEDVRTVVAKGEKSANNGYSTGASGYSSNSGSGTTLTQGSSAGYVSPVASSSGHSTGNSALSLGGAALSNVAYSASSPTSSSSGIRVGRKSSYRRAQRKNY